MHSSTATCWSGTNCFKSMLQVICDDPHCVDLVACEYLRYAGHCKLC